MENVDNITIGLIVGGALILLFAMSQTFKIFRLVDDERFKRGWRNLFFLMAFFFIGYFGVVYIVILKEYSLLQVLTGVIFFFGAVFVCLVVVLGSVTLKALKKANNALEDKVSLLKTQNDQLTQFNYATSHDLKEPVNTVVSCVNMLKDEYGDRLDETGHKFMDYALKGTERMSELVSGLSDYMTVGMGSNMKEVDLNEMVNGVVQEMHGSIKESKAIVKVHEMPTLKINEKELKRVFQNLISNSLKYRKEDIRPEIEVTSNQDIEKGFWEFNISDNGIGIKEKHFQKVFQLFRQLNKNKYEGMGIGLAITKKVVELHGGSITVDSEEGVGTRFTFTVKG